MKISLGRGAVLPLVSLVLVAVSSACGDETQKSHLQVFAGDKLSEMRLRVKDYDFESDGLAELLVDSEKKYVAIVFRLTESDGRLSTVEILGVRRDETRALSKRTLRMPGTDASFLVARLKLWTRGS